MLITAAGITHVGEWLSLAREMEPIFGASMADDEQFRQFVSRRIETGEALVALDRMNGNAVMGVIAFSRSGNCVVWLGVFSRYRRRSVGSKLTESAIRQLDAGCYDGKSQFCRELSTLVSRVLSTGPTSR